jgi:hypothetical protein
VNRVPEFDGPEFRGYLRKPIPDPTDATVGALVGRYEIATPEDRQAMLEEMRSRPRTGDVLACYAQRMATFAVHEDSSDPIRSGLIAIGLGSPGVDFRYNEIATALLFHSAGLLGAAFDDLVEEVAALIPPRPLERLRRFSSWREKNRRVESMGYTPEGTGRDFRYRPVPPSTGRAKGLDSGPG